MADKPDYYEVLGITKTATKAEIKTAYQRIVMKNHPDMVKNKKYASEAEKAKAIADADVKFKQATEAEKVLSDDTARTAYDMYGHKGVENIQAGKSAASGRSYADVAGPITRKTYSEDDLMDFFGKAKERREREEVSDDGLTPEQRRAKAREERLARRNGGSTPSSTNTTPTEPEKGSAGNAFHVVAEKVTEATQKLKDGVELPLPALQKFRDNLSDFLGEIDKAINKAKNGPGPKFS